MSEDNLNYVNKTILNVLPDAVDLSKEIKYSSYVTRREYVEVFPSTSPPETITASNLGTSVRINLADPSRWLDRSNAVLQMDIGEIAAANATDVGNFAVLDGPCAMIARANVYVGGQLLNSGTINSLNKVACAVQANSGSIASYLSDEAALTGGCEKLRSVLNGVDVPNKKAFYAALNNSPFNLLPGAVAGTSAACKDALGVTTVAGAPLTTATGNAASNYYGYSNSNYVSSRKQTVAIPLSVLHPFFEAYEMLPLFICKDVVLELFFASPTQTFVSDISTAAAAARSSIVSYKVANLKVCCDLVTCSDELNDLYKLKAASSEGLIIPYDDWAISSKTTQFTAGGAVSHQAILSTNNLKSMVFFRQSEKVATAQNGFSNSNFMYMGLQNYQTTINNTNFPPNAISSPQGFIAYSARSRGAVHNQLSNTVANNPYVAYRAECLPTGAGADTDIPAAITSFVVYNNYEKIHEDIDVGNGISLNSAGSMLTVKYVEDSGVPAAAKAASIIGAAGDTYTLYLLMTYGKALVFADGAIQVRG